jgi:S1-C subfamily serine protease
MQMFLTSRRLILLTLALLLAAILVPLAGCGDEESSELDSTKISEYNKPGTVLVETVWSADVSFPELAIDYDALEAWFINAALAGNISLEATEEEIATALVTELVTFPELYLFATTADRVTTQEASVYGSGFVVTDDGSVVTNAHIVKKSDEELATTMAEENLVDVLEEDLTNFETELGIDLPPEYEDYFINAAIDLYSAYYTVSSPTSKVSVYTVSVGDESMSDAIPAEVVEVGDPINMQEETSKDVAILKVNKTSMATVAMGDDKDLMDGDPVWALGYPDTATFDYTLDLEEELAPTLTQGTVSAKKTVSGGWEVIQTDAYTTHGSSGSPLLNSKGEAVSVNTFGAGDVSESTGEFEASPGFNFSIPATVINEFLNQANVTPALGSLTETYREAIDLYMDKHYSAAKEKFEEIRDANSEFPYVQEYIEQSAAKVSAGEDVSTFPIPTWLLILLIAAGSAIGIGIGVFLVMRSNKKKDAAAAGAGAATAPAAATAPVESAPAAETPAAPEAETAEAAPPAAPESTDTEKMPAAEAGETVEPTAETPAPEAASKDTEGGEEHNFCAKCGQELAEGSAFCAKCGEKV